MKSENDRFITQRVIPSNGSAPTAMSRNVELRTWFIEPVFTPDRQLSTGMVRVWGKTRDTRLSAKWWRSSSIQQRMSSTTLKTRYGTRVSLRGGICKKYARKLRMEADAIERFYKGFPATWKKLLKQSFSADILNESDRLVQPRRSIRNREKKNSPENVQREDTISSPQRGEEKEQENGTTSQGQVPKRRSLRKKPVDTAPPAKEPPRKVAKKKPPVGRSNRSLASKLKSAQDAKKARRARRVAFADVPDNVTGVASSSISRTPRQPRNAAAALTSLQNSSPPEWSDSQRRAFDIQRNSVAADAGNYWEAIAFGVRGKSAHECQALWESSWTSPQAKQTKRVSVKEASAEDMVADLQKAVRSKRSRNTAKFRSQTRHLVELVAAGTLDAVLEPSVPGASAAKNIAVTPRLQGIGAVSKGTPGTEVRRRREQNEREGTVATPEILSRGRKVGFAEADHYVSLFKRRAGKSGGKVDSQEPEKQESRNDSAPPLEMNIERRISDAEDLLGLRAGDDDESDYSDEGSPFF